MIIKFHKVNLKKKFPLQISRGTHSESQNVFIEIIEDLTGIKAIKNYLPMQMGDIYKTYASILKLKKMFGYHPKVEITTGIRKFIKWYLKYNIINK